MRRAVAAVALLAAAVVLYTLPSWTSDYTQLVEAPGDEDIADPERVVPAAGSAR